MRTGVTRAGRSLLPTSRSWRARPEPQPDGRLRTMTSPDPLWPEYGRLLTFMNWLEDRSFTIAEHRGPFRQRGNELLVDRRFTAVGRPCSIADLEKEWSFGEGIELVERPGGPGTPIARIRDGVRAGDHRYSVDLRMAVNGDTLVNDDRDTAFRALIRLGPALAATPTWNGRDVPAEHPAEAGWGRLPYIVQSIQQEGGRLSTRPSNQRLSKAVEHSATVLWRGHSTLDDLRLPDGMAAERLDDGTTLVRDFPGGFASERARFALAVLSDG